MDFVPSARAQEYATKVRAFLDDMVIPAEAAYEAQRAASIDNGEPHVAPAVVQQLKQTARSAGLWNLFLPDSTDPAHGLSVLDYAPSAEFSGWAPHLAPEAMNCSAPDTGNMEILHLFGTAEQQSTWLAPLLDGSIRSAFAMTEPDVASSDARAIQTSIVRDGDEFVITGRKWWTTGACDPRCTVLIVMGVTDPDADAYRRQSMVIVPIDTPGLRVIRNLTVFGYVDQHGHAEIEFDGVRVPRSNVLGEPGDGFAIAQARLGPGRIHHCMRSIGTAERALRLMVDRASSRAPFGRPLSDQGVIREWIGRSRVEIDQARLLVLHAAWTIDAHGTKSARQQIAAIKAIAPEVALRVVDRAIQTYGGAGVGADTPLPSMWAHLRTLRIADGPDEVHWRDVARLEIGR